MDRPAGPLGSSVTPDLCTGGRCAPPGTEVRLAVRRLPAHPEAPPSRPRVHLKFRPRSGQARNGNKESMRGRLGAVPLDPSCRMAYGHTGLEPDLRGPAAR